MSLTADPQAAAVRVVVVEDDPSSADVLARRLEANGMTVAVARDGSEGLSVIRRVHPDLVLLDVMLPDTDGYDVCLRVKSDPATSDIPIIFVSARGDVIDKVRGLSSGAADYLTKPFHPAELLARIDAVLRQAREGRAGGSEPPPEETAGARPAVAIAVRDPARAERVRELLAPRFDIAADGASEAELLVLDVDAPAPAAERAFLRVAPDGAAATGGAVVVGPDLPRIAELAIRERRLRRDVRAATEALVVLASALEAHDRSLAGHGERVAARAVSIATVLGVDRPTCEAIRLGALLRDIGNARLPAAVLARTKGLAEDERAMVQRHPLLGEELLAGFRPLAPVLRIVRSHHEHLDGSGYPDRLRGEQIPLEVRIVTAADRFEALIADRPDRSGVAPEEAVRMLQSDVEQGRLDAAVVAALGWIVRERPPAEGGHA